MALIVQKFGGTSLGSPQRIQSVAQRIARAYFRGDHLVIVVSAMGQTTDKLIELALEVSKAPPHREMDMLLTAGERISMSLLSMALADCKVPALSFTGSQSGIITDQNHRRAKIKRILGNRVKQALADGAVAIVAGFQGVSDCKEITTLGRGGSDTTAVALAATLNADSCEIYTDVDGVYSADPRQVAKAQLWNKISHNIMLEMATRGAAVLHPRSVELAKQYQVPLWVKNSFNEKEGTLVMTDFADNLKSSIENFQVTGVTADLSKLHIAVKLSRPSVMGALWDSTAKAHLSILSPVFYDDEVWFFSDREAEEEWKKSLESLVMDGFIKNYQMNSDCVPLSVIGNRFSQDGQALLEITEILASKGIFIKMGTASSLVITVGVPLVRAEEGVKILHQHFLEGNSE